MQYLQQRRRFGRGKELIYWLSPWGCCDLHSSCLVRFERSPKSGRSSPAGGRLSLRCGQSRCGGAGH